MKRVEISNCNNESSFIHHGGNFSNLHEIELPAGEGSYVTFNSMNEFSITVEENCIEFYSLWRIAIFDW